MLENLYAHLVSTNMKCITLLYKTIVSSGNHMCLQNYEPNNVTGEIIIHSTFPQTVAHEPLQRRPTELTLAHAFGGERLQTFPGLFSSRFYVRSLKQRTELYAPHEQKLMRGTFASIFWGSQEKFKQFGNYNFEQTHHRLKNMQHDKQFLTIRPE